MVLNSRYLLIYRMTLPLCNKVASRMLLHAPSIRTSILKNSNPLERIDRTSRLCLDLLSTIWVPGNDKYFSTLMETLISDMSQLETFDKLRLRLESYQLRFKIDTSERPNDSSLMRSINTHSIDTWRMTLLQVSNISLRLLNQQMRIKKKDLGLYIQMMQHKATERNNKLQSHCATIRTIGNKLREMQQSRLAAESQDKLLDNDYEVIMPKAYSMFGYWFQP